MEALTSIVRATARGRIEVADAGTPNGPALLVVHGSPGDYRQGQTLVEDLGDVARVLLVSRPGYGSTPLSSGRSPQDQASLYAAVLDDLGIQRALILGISGGGPSSYAFAVQHPDRCTGLVLCCAVAAHVRIVPAAMRRLAAVPGLWAGLAAVSRTVARVRPPAPPADNTFTPAERALLDEPGVRPALERFHRDGPTWTSGAGLRNDVLQLLAAPTPRSIQVPTWVLHGTGDEVVPVSHAQAYADLAPGADLELLEGLGHAVPLFARARVAEGLRALLATPSDGAGRPPNRS